ncbi:MAG: MauE/DoxX family redox-associated membrane protein [Terriglobia bacterium]
MLGRVLGWVCRLTLGGLFIYAGFTKLYPAEHRFLFEIALDTYQLLPAPAVIAVAFFLPWLEVALGVLLLGGWKLHYIATFISALLAVFIGAMSITYARGIEANCGCFGFGEPITPTTLARDGLMLAMAIFLARRAWRTRPLAAAPAD